MGEAVREFSLEKNLKPHKTFCPLGFAEWDRILIPNEKIDLEDSYAIHLWNERWRVTGQNKNREYPPDSLYEQLKRRYL